MPRPPPIHPPVKLDVRFPLPLRAKMDIHLFSKIEGKVPKGAYARFLRELVENFFREQERCETCGRARAKE